MARSRSNGIIADHRSDCSREDPSRHPPTMPAMHLRAPMPGVALPGSLVAIGDRTGERIVVMLDAEIQRWSAVAPEVGEPLRVLRDLVAAGGKRLRPAFCYWSFVGAGGDPDDATVVDVGAALELLHTFALVHDD